MSLPSVASLLSLLTGCAVTHRPDCDVEVRDVADDESLGDLSFTVEELVASTAGDFTADVRDVAGGTHPTVVSSVRGTGSAVFHDATPTSHDTKHFGFGSETLLIAVSCDDEVEVPMNLSLHSDDGAIVVDGDALAWSDPGDPVQVTIARDLNPATEVLPPPTGAQTDGHVEVQYAGGALTTVSGWWGANEDYEQSIEWP